MAVTPIPNGSLTSPRGFRAGATFAGLKKPGQDVLDMCLFAASKPCAGAGVFTKNKVVAAPVIVSHEHLQKARPRAVVVNSGTANASVGEQGLIDAREMTRLVAKKLKVEPEEVLVCSTGVIGVELPMGIIRRGIDDIQLGDGGHDFARAIMTTDTRPKETAVRTHIGNVDVIVGGCAKGAGMIHPDMATMLGFLTTDADVDPGCLQRVLAKAVDETFNMITVDGDTSTNDTVFLLANGEAGNPTITGGQAEKALQEAVTHVCLHLAKAIAMDGEGATKLIEVRVESAKDVEDARRAARTIAGSTLLKAAVYGNDPNWGRAIAALGRSGADFDDKKLVLYINDICVLDEGKPIPFFKDAAIATMRQSQVSFVVRLGVGDATATAWSCDLTEEYVRINSAYTT
jgi:glutamate N-acetyltransferase/amino-acid N-acetyltransferase